MIPLNPYSLMEGINTLFGHTEIQSEQAIHFFVKFSIPVEPGGHTGYFLISLTVDALVGFGAVTFCAEDEFDIPRNKRTDPAIISLLLLSIASPSSAPDARFLKETIP